MILVIDNYDSFTYNLVQLIELYYPDVKVIKNDVLNLDDIKSLNAKGIVLSPGPGRPEDAGVTLDVIQEMAHLQPILGICLGHQSIAQVYGGTICPAEKIIHGKTEEILHDGKGIYKDLHAQLVATRYHSLSVNGIEEMSDLVVTAYAKSDQCIMGVRHKKYPVEGVQFHPESYLTSHGHQLIQNFITQVIKEDIHV